jgi:hypothetical protein
MSRARDPFGFLFRAARKQTGLCRVLLMTVSDGSGSGSESQQVIEGEEEHFTTQTDLLLFKYLLCSCCFFAATGLGQPSVS